MNKLVTYIKNNSKKAIIILFIIMFISGLLFIPKVNANFDEMPEENILLSNIREYSELIHFDRLTNYINEKGIPAISKNSEKDHGIAAYYLFTPALKLEQNHPHVTSVLWHLYTYIIFFLGVIFYYMLVKFITKKEKASMIMTLLYFISPRIFIDGMHNNKDIILMSLLIVMIYFGFKLIEKPKLKYVLLFSIFASIVCNVKILGIFFTGIIGLIYILYMTINKKWNKETFKYCVETIIITLGLYLVLTPAIWGSGFKLIEFITYCTQNGVNFRGEMTVLFEGIRHTKSVNPLPWYYVPKMITITIPIITTLLFIYSFILVVINIIKNFIKKKIEFNDYIYLAVIMMFIVPFAIAVFSQPNVYNGWRHFYFLYSFILIISSYGFIRLSKNKITSKIVLIGILVTIICNVFYICRYGVANTAYYNILVNRTNLEERYELDYYDVTAQDALKKFIKSKDFEENEDKKIYLCGYGFNNRIITDTYGHTNESLRKKIVIVSIEELDNYLNDGKIVYNLYNPIYATNDMSDYKEVYTYKIFNSKIIKFYKMNKE
jgi:hypothetical protein